MRQIRKILLPVIILFQLQNIFAQNIEDSSLSKEDTQIQVSEDESNSDDFDEFDSFENFEESTESEKIKNSDEDNNSIKPGGLIRNDAVYSRKESENIFNDVLELKLTLEKKENKTQIYADGRVYGYYGDKIEENEKYNAVLVRAFIRYYFENNKADFTIGKTFINIGNQTLFNPFSMDKSINFSETGYDKEGILSSELKIYPSDLSEWQTFVSYNSDFNNYRAGSSYLINIKSFDIAAAYIRYGHDRKSPAETILIEEDYNKIGFYFKGDIFLTVKGSYCFHIADSGNYKNHEAEIGIDYSFYSGKVFAETNLYYNRKGATKPENYEPVPDSFLKGRYYNYSAVNYKYDDFLNFSADAFININDRSVLSSLSASYLAAQSLTFTLKGINVYGDEEDEFSPTLFGLYSVILRAELKF